MNTAKGQPMKEKRYFADIRVGIAVVVDSKVSEKCNCVDSYPQKAIKLKIRGHVIYEYGKRNPGKQRRKLFSHWKLPFYAEFICKTYAWILNIGEN